MNIFEKSLYVKYISTYCVIYIRYTDCENTLGIIKLTHKYSNVWQAFRSHYLL